MDGKEPSPEGIIESICSEFSRRWQAGETPLIEEHLYDAPDGLRERLLRELLLLDLLSLSARGETPAYADYASRFRQDREIIGEVFTLFGFTEPGDSSASTILYSPPTSDEACYPEIDDYEILGEIARGRTGVVYRARQVSRKRLVALKTIFEEVAAQGDVEFQDQLTAVAKLDHPNLVPVLDFGEQDGGRYLSMGLVKGRSLGDPSHDGPLSPQASAQLVTNLAEAVAYAHGKGVLHRNLAPSKVLLDRERTPSIVGFGLVDAMQTSAGETSAEHALGTPGYLAPEQALDTNDKTDPHVDVYALGAILYRLVTGRDPFCGESRADTLRRVRRGHPAPPSRIDPSIPRSLEAICMKCLEKAPSRRYQSAALLLDDLQRYLEGQPVSARPVGWWGRRWRWCRRHPFAAITSAAAVVLVAAAMPFALDDLQSPQRTANQPQRTRDENSLGVADLPADKAQKASNATTKSSPQGPEPEGRVESVAEGARNFWVAIARGKELYESGKFDQCIEVLQQAIDVDPEHATARLRLGIALRAVGRDDEAIAELQQSLRLDPKSVAAHRLLAGILMERRDYDAAAKALVRATEALPGNVELQQRLKLVEEKAIPGWLPSWSPTGHSIIVRSRRDTLTVVNVKTNERRIVLRNARDPLWSPVADGPIAFYRRVGGEGQIWLSDSEGRNSRKLAQGSWPAGWSADGRTLYFTHKGFLYSINVQEEPALPAACCAVRHPYVAVSPDGKMVANHESDRLVVREIETGNQLANCETPGWIALPGWSPDSRKVVFGSQDGKSSDGLWILDVESGRKFQVTTDKASFGRWSPDGSQIAYDLRLRLGNFIKIIDVADISWPDDSETVGDEEPKTTQAEGSGSDIPANPFPKEVGRSTCNSRRSRQSQERGTRLALSQREGRRKQQPSIVRGISRPSTASFTSRWLVRTSYGLTHSAATRSACLLATGVWTWSTAPWATHPSPNPRALRPMATRCSSPMAGALRSVECRLMGSRTRKWRRLWAVTTCPAAEPFLNLATSTRRGMRLVSSIRSASLITTV